MTGKKTRQLGIILAAVGRLGLLSTISWVLTLNQPIAIIIRHQFSWKSLILLAGGIFLLYKAVTELHETVGPKEKRHHDEASKKQLSVASAIGQICLLDLVFSLDSVITAVGLTTSIPIIFAAVIASAACVLFISSPIIAFIHKHPSLKVLALAFLVVIGVVICLEAFGQHVPKAYIYLPLGFCLLVEFLQMSRTKNEEIIPCIKSQEKNSSNSD